MSRSPNEPARAKLALRKKQIRTLSGADLDDARGGRDFGVAPDNTAIPMGDSKKVGTVGGDSGSARSGVGG